MANINYLAILNDWSFLPPGTVCRIGGTTPKFDYTTDAVPIATVPKEVLKRVDSKGTILYVKVGETAQTSAELKKEGKDPFIPIKIDIGEEDESDLIARK